MGAEFQLGVMKNSKDEGWLVMVVLRCECT